MSKSTKSTNSALLLDTGIISHLSPEDQKQARDLLAERKRLDEKLERIQTKLDKVKESRRKLQMAGKVRAGDETAKRKAWEESLLKQQQEAEAGEELETGERSPKPLSAKGKKIEKLQGEFKSLQIRIKTMDGMMKPLKKNLNTLMAENKELRDKFTEIQNQTKEVEENNVECKRRQAHAESRTEELTREAAGINYGKSVAPIRGADFQGAMNDILDILGMGGVDEDLQDDIREKIQAFEAAMPSSPGASLNNSLHSLGDFTKTPKSAQSRRRTLQGSFGDLGLRSPNF